MGVEIERKFLVLNQDFKDEAWSNLDIKQAYIGYGKCLTRVRTADEKAYLTIKGSAVGTFGIKEWEYEIPMDDALEMINEATDFIHKTRWLVTHEDHLWEVDEFHNANEGLVVAEIELQAENEVFSTPKWIGDDVTGIEVYKNVRLVESPYTKWNFEGC